MGAVSQIRARGVARSRSNNSGYPGGGGLLSSSDLPSVGSSGGVGGGGAQGRRGGGSDYRRCRRRCTRTPHAHSHSGGLSSSSPLDKNSSHENGRDQCHRKRRRRYRPRSEYGARGAAASLDHSASDIVPSNDDGVRRPGVPPRIPGPRLGLGLGRGGIDAPGRPSFGPLRVCPPLVGRDRDVHERAVAHRLDDDRRPAERRHVRAHWRRRRHVGCGTRPPQVHPFLVSIPGNSFRALIRNDPALDRIVTGLIRRTAMYANAFRIDDAYKFSELQREAGRARPGLDVELRAGFGLLLHTDGALLLEAVVESRADTAAAAGQGGGVHHGRLVGGGSEARVGHVPHGPPVRLR